ncbi:MAG: fibronectin type III domain-containing protein [Clostridia bacterium]|nr:fibronectin type III domain-containing protein [Clostridia bacterium]
MKRLLSILLTVCMLTSLLPAQVFAEDGAQQPRQVIDLPIITEGDVMMEEAAGGSLLIRDESTAYFYQGSTRFYFDAKAWLRDENGEILTSPPEANGILQMVDADGTVLAASEAVSYSSTYRYDDVNQTSYYLYYVSYVDFSADTGADPSLIPAGTYSLQLYAGNTVYETDGKVTVVGSEDLLLDYAYAYMYTGADSMDVRIGVYGFADDTELGDLTFELVDSTDTVVGSSQGRYRDFAVNDYYGVTEWSLYTELLLEDGYVLEEDAQYTLRICYSGDRTLYSAVVFSANSPYTPNVQFTAFEITDAQTSRIALTVENWDPTLEYTVIASTEVGNGEVQVLNWTGYIPEDGILELQLTLNGSVVPATAFGPRFDFEILWMNEWNGTEYSTADFENPYADEYGGGSGDVYLASYWLSAKAESWTFTLRGYNSNLYLREGDVAVLLDSDGNEIARCTQFTEVEYNAYSFEITGTFVFTSPLVANGWYTFVFNDTEINDLRASVLTLADPYPVFKNWDDDTFFLNMGIFPVSAEAINSSGKGTISIVDAEGNTVLSSGTLTGVPLTDGFTLEYSHQFTAADFKALTPGDPYILRFTDSVASNNTDMEEANSYEMGVYDNTVVLPDYMTMYDMHLRGYEREVGDSFITMEYYLSNGAIKNITEQDLDVLIGAEFVNEDDGTSCTVTELANGRWSENGYYNYCVDLILSDPLTAGSYNGCLEGMEFYHFYIDEPEAPRSPQVSSSCDLDEGRFYGHWLPEEGVYTGKLYDGYTCLTETPLALTWELLDEQTYLAYDLSVLKALDLASGDYELRVWLDGTPIGCATIRVTGATMPVVSIHDASNYDLTLSNYSGRYRFEVVNPGIYTRIRCSEDPDALADAEYYRISDNYGHWFSEGGGERTVYVQLQSADGLTESEIFTFNVWYMPEGSELPEITVPEDVQGIYSGRYLSFEVGASNRYFQPVMEYETSDGYTDTLPLHYLGTGQPAGLYPPAVHGLESEHPFRYVDNYSDYYTKTWTYTEEGADSLRITFSPATALSDNCELTLYSGIGDAKEYIRYFDDYDYRRGDLAGQSFIIPGDSFTVVLETYRTADPCYGFAITEVETLTAAEALAAAEVSEDIVVDEEVIPESPPAEEAPVAPLGLYLYGTGLTDASDSALIESETVRFYLMDEQGDPVSDTVERMLIFGNPDTVILPQFRDGDIYCTEETFPLYGYATPGSTVTVAIDDETAATAVANAVGYFSVELTALPQGSLWLTVSDDSGITDSIEVQLIVDSVAPVIKSINFTFAENNAATLRWECDDTDVYRFEILKNKAVLDRYVDRNTRTYSVSATADDGNFFTVRAVDEAGNVGELTVSTADQIPPEAPASITASNITTTSVELTWDEGSDNIGVMGYTVFMDGKELEYLAGETSRSYTVTGLESGVTYTFSVRTRDKAGNLSVAAAEAEVTTVGLIITPGVESSYVVDAYPGRSIPITYTVTPSVEGYTPVLDEAWLEFRLSGSENAWAQQYLYSDGTGSWNISGSDTDGYLPKGSYDLYFHVTDSLGAEAVSEPVTVVVLTIDEEAPSAPGIPEAVSHTTTSIFFQWEESTDNIGVDHYEIWRDGAKIAETASTGWEDTDLTMGTYTYTLKAVDYRGNTSESSAAAQLSTMVLEFDGVIDFADSYVLEDQLYASIDVWADFKAQEGYTPSITMALEYKAADAETWVVSALNTIDGEDASVYLGVWDISGEELGYLPAGEYTVRFSVTDGSATAYSEEQTVALLGETEAPIIDYIHPAGGTMGGKAISLSTYATDNVSVTSLTLSYAPEGSDTFTDLHSEAFPDVAYTWDASSLPSGAYVIKATATDPRGNVGESTVTITVDNTPPAVPAGVTATGTSRYIHVMWDTGYEVSSDFNTFRVYRAQSADGPFERVMDQAAFGYYDNGETVTGRTTYYYYVTAVDVYGNESAAEQTVSAVLQPDTESPEIGDMRPYANKGLRRETTVSVTAADNYRLAKAVFSYRLKGSQQWIEIATVPVTGITDNTVFSAKWDIPDDITKGVYELKAEVYDDSINDVELGYPANDPGVWQQEVTLYPYSAPVAPQVTATAAYKQATFDWTYSGDTETLQEFTVYRTDASGGEQVYATAAAKGKTGSCTVSIPASGQQYFVVVARDIYGFTAASTVISVTSAPRETEPPVAVLQPETLTAAAGVPFAFSAVNSTDNDEIVSYAWNFGDGATGTGVSPTHTYAGAGAFTVTLTVTDACGNETAVQRTMNVYAVGGESATHALMTVTAVNSFVEGTPAVSGADVKILVQDEDGNTTFEFSALAGSDGKVTAVVPVGQVNVSAIADGYVASSRAVTVEPDETGAFAYTLGLTPMNVSLVDGSLTVEEMTYSEILAAGIDVTDPDNNHVWKFAAELEFVAAPAFPFDLPRIPVTGYFNGAGKFIGGSGWGWNHVGGSGGGGGTGWGMNIGIFPISEHFLLVIYGEAHWLKEMYNVELLVINNSYVDDITDCKAALMLPDGLSLAAMTGAAQDLTVDLGTIPHKTSANDGANTAKANWYVRGDKEGEYNLTASVIGRNPDIFVKSFTTDKPVKVYAGSALHLTITAEDIAYRGEEYHVRFKLQNVSHKNLYNLSFGITGADQFKVVTMGDNEAMLELSHEDFADNMTRSVDILQPGGSITIDFYTTVWFNSLLELADLGPFDVGYYLTNVFVTTLEGSTTTIPYDIQIAHSSHGTFFEWLEEELKDGAVDAVIDLVEKKFLDEIPFISTAKKVFEFVAHGEADSRCVIQIEGGYVTSSNNFLRRSIQPAAEGAIAIYTDAEHIISDDGKTLTLLGSGKIYVEGKKPGDATLTVITTANEGAQEHVHTLNFSVARGSADAEDLILQAPAVGLEDGKAAIPLAGSTLDITFPYLLKGSDGSYMTTAPNAVWSVSGDDTDGITVENGIVTVRSRAKAGDYTVTLTVGEKSASQPFTLTREASVAQYVEISSGTAVLGDSYLLTYGAGAMDFTAQVFDQYGVAFDEAVTWTSEGSASVAAVSGSRVTPGTESGTVTLKTAVTSNAALTDSLTVTVIGSSDLQVSKTVTAIGCAATVTNGSDQSVTLQALIAIYDADGRMLSCRTQVITLAAGTSQELSLTCSAKEQVADGQVFLVNAASMAPVPSAQ